MSDNSNCIKHDTQFFERYARVSLINLIDERFESLTNQDRPDLQDESRGIGIEVTRAIQENAEVAKGLISEMAGQPDAVSQRDWLDMTHYGYSYGLHKDLIGKIEYAYWSTALPLRRIIKSKVEKVAGGFYGNFNQFGLYIFVKEDLDDQLLKHTINYTLKLQKGNAHKYSVMYISQISDLFVCDLEDASFSKIPISEPLRRLFYREAIKP